MIANASLTPAEVDELASAHEAAQAHEVSAVRNGINVLKLRGAIDAIRADAAAGQTRWSVNSRWTGGTRSEHDVGGCEIGGRRVDRRFTMRVDEPVELCGTDRHANPQEYLLAALNACMMVGFTAVAALKGITLRKLEITTTGDIDLRGFLGLDASVPAGYPSLQQTITVVGDATPDQLREVHEIVQRTSPNYFNVTHAIATASRLVIG